MHSPSNPTNNLLLNGNTVVTLDANPPIRYKRTLSETAGTVFLKDNALLYVISGELHLRYGSVMHRVERKQIAFIKKDSLVDVQASPRQTDEQVECSFVIVSLERDTVTEFLKLVELTYPERGESKSINVYATGKQLRRFFQSMKTYLLTSGIDRRLAKIKIFELLFNLAEAERNIFMQLMDLRQHYRTDITAVVEGNVTNSIALDELASLSGRSLSSFRRDFLAIYNMPPSKWIRQRRLEKAKEMLQHTTMSVTDICFSLGFENIGHFSKLFKTHFNCPPSQYRFNTPNLSR
ncbi:helix-turn-helix transcriptional regulator [Chryseolinea sp. T2]|uniref:helix-turn-helix domain-containing protein n=1 Tax=Chryseolinea sp. T2 TaxID=3129255 RepID=UPI0030777778